jgi:integrase
MATALQSEALLLPSRDASKLCSQGQHVSEQGGSLARRRYQRGQVLLKKKFDENGRVDKDQSEWIGRWREDEVRNGQLVRLRCRRFLGTLKQFKNKRQALKALGEHIKNAGVNREDYRPLQAAKFADFAERWEEKVITQLKPSTQANFRSHLRKYLNPFFGEMHLRELRAETVQQFVASLTVSPKTAKNMIVTLRVLWNSAKAWGYVDHDPFAGIRLPKSRSPRRMSLTLDEVQRLLAAADDSYKTFYWLAAETGMRAGELCGLRVEDLNLEQCQVTVNQSAWRGRISDPKTANGIRCFSLSRQLTLHLSNFLLRWRPNDNRLLFASRNGTPWDANLLVKRKLHPLLAQLKIARCGLHAFRHANATLMDRLHVPMKIRQQRLGHSDPRITLGTYTHLASSDDERIAMQLGEILDPDGPNNKKTEVSVSANSGLIN